MAEVFRKHDIKCEVVVLQVEPKGAEVEMM